MNPAPKPPPAYEAFVAQYPKIGKAWELIAEAGQEGPLDEKTARLVKLAVAVGAMREGAVRAGVRKARALGLGREVINQVIALAASTLGFPAAVAVFTWVQDVYDESGEAG
jgi:alkylhydroperoxidase/carboxymuconolactone decarboxylase family protein YurZ